MKIHEYLAKDILRAERVKVPRSYLVTSEELAEEKFLRKCLERLGFPQVLKAQVLVGGRMKAGGIVLAEDLEKSLEGIKKILGMKIKGEEPFGVLVEEYIPHDTERYISLSIDRNVRDIVFVYSEVGGVNIEEFALKYPDKVLRTSNIHDLPKDLQDFAKKLYKIFVRYDLTLLEINPFVLKDGDFYALDAVFHVDDSALFRQLWASEDDVENNSFVAFENGEVGVIGCGAGIVMATIDALVEYGYKPANFCDLGGGATMESVCEALRKVKSLCNKAVLNIFGGITDCLEIAKGVVNFKEENPDFEIYIRLSGNNEFLARELLKQHKIDAVEDMKELIERLQRDTKTLKRGVSDVL
ncbi:succinate--CoA ligase [Fervidobacterium pennivorans subsp. carthaginiensis]|jgi:succinyl-CoA synthetase beta subunit|uniref:ATP-grasp domain-containing protein n=1 Tax=Fervidobacterium pennivorans TaxID=93466 RepID=UPI0014367449|nr:ATP-grasp domain-containing protein [Fervidobacterium pennivorans]QIV77790.1 succinate--CoA ligase [Fervidobacterium pennivorans subsp. keratinolyticus]